MKPHEIVGKSDTDLKCKGLKNIEFVVTCESRLTGMVIVEFVTGGNPKVGYFHIEDFSEIK